MGMGIMFMMRARTAKQEPGECSKHGKACHSPGAVVYAQKKVVIRRRGEKSREFLREVLHRVKQWCPFRPYRRPPGGYDLLRVMGKSGVLVKATQLVDGKIVPEKRSER